MQLFKVVTVYSNGGYVPSCQEIIVIKETPKQWLVEATLASDHCSRISKDDISVAQSQVEAWDKYIRKAKQVLMTMGVKLTEHINFVNHAILERAWIVEQQGTKIGGTD